MSRHKHQMTRESVNEPIARNDLKTVSGSNILGEAGADFRMNQNEVPESSLKTAVRLSMSAPSEQTRDLFSRVIRDAMEKIRLDRTQSAFSWSKLPTIKSLVESRREAKRVAPNQEIAKLETAKMSPIESPFRDYVATTPNDRVIPQEMVNEQVNPLISGQIPSKAGPGGMNPRGNLNGDPSLATSSDAAVRFSQIAPSTDSTDLLRSMQSVTAESDRELATPIETDIPSRPFWFPIDERGASERVGSESFPLRSGQNDLSQADFNPPKPQTGRVTSPLGTSPFARALPISSSSGIDLTQLSEFNNPFAPLLGDSTSVSGSGQEGNKQGVWSDDGSTGSSNSLGSVGVPQESFASSDSSGGQGSDLSRTNELLQQLLDEYRKNQQSYLPLNDRNTSMT